MLFPPPHQTNASPRVVVTGAGIITALGQGWDSNASGFRSGRVAFGPVKQFDVTRQRVQVAAEASLPAELPPTRLSSRSVTRLDRAAMMLLLATHEAWTQSGWSPSENLPLVLGTTSGGMSLGQALYRQAVQAPHSHKRQPTRVVQYQPQLQALTLAKAFGFEGPVTIIANACASGANAIGHAFDLLQRGVTDRVLAGGYEALCQLLFAGFDSLQALSPTQCASGRPRLGRRSSNPCPGDTRMRPSTRS